MPGRSAILYGTDEPAEPMRQVGAGRLRVGIAGGNLRYVAWDGVEVLRAISFVVRDTRWGTYAPAIAGLEIAEGEDRFDIRYEAAVAGPEGDFRYRVHIAGEAAGRLAFTAEGRSDGGFDTNRTGFVVLHGIEGVAGLPVEVEHSGGERSEAVFPRLVSPSQPIMDIRALTHRPEPGLVVQVRLDGDAYEMEDQRNWTDASFKTYVRPLSRGFPYRIAAGETVRQSVALMIVDERHRPAARSSGSRAVTVGGRAGAVPAIGIAAGLADLPAVADLPAFALQPPSAFVVVRVDLRTPRDLDRLDALAPLARDGKVGIDLDVIVGGRAPDEELAPLGAALSRHGIVPKRVLVVSEPNLRSRLDGRWPDGVAPDAAIVASARRAFPGSAIGGGTVVGFPEFNRARPPADVDFVAHSTQAIVHAADDVSVMETLEALPDLIATTRSFAPAAAYRLGPGTIGAPADFYAVPPADNPLALRLPTAARDPRQRGLFAASFALGYLAQIAGHRVDAVTLSALRGPVGIGDEAGAWPVGMLLAQLAAASGRPRLDTALQGRGFAALALESGHGRQLWLANLTAQPLAIEIAGLAPACLRVLDAAALAAGCQSMVARPLPAGTTLPLDAYAVACVEG